MRARASSAFRSTSARRSLAFLARILWLQGPSGAGDAGRLSAPWSMRRPPAMACRLCHALAMAAWPRRAVQLGSRPRPAPCRAAAPSLPTKNALSLRQAWRRKSSGYARRIRAATSAMGPDLIRAGFDDLGIGNQGFQGAHLPGRAGQRQGPLRSRGRWAGRDRGSSSIAPIEPAKDGCSPELRRINGALLLQRNLAGAVSEAETCFREALEQARGQGARSWELRAAESLARLLRDQGRSIEAMEILRPVYDQFTEGWDTADLKSARALLDSVR